MSRNLCNVNFESQFCHCRNKEYAIEFYINNRDKFKHDTIYCRNAHELILANGKIRRPYFRHIHPEDTGGSPMTRWHSEWQSNFPRTEIRYDRKNSNQIKSRIADVDLVESNRILELQHSPITKEEVDERLNDYTKVHNKNIVWVIHGNGAVNIRNFEQTKRVYLEFTADFWKYESFLEYDYIYIDEMDKIYKISPKMVKSHMIDVEEPKVKKDFINALKNGTELWSDNEPVQCKLFIKQQGAGNGKTYGIIQMLESDEVAHYNTFIFVTKQHSAKGVIVNELQNQVEDGHLKYIEEIEIEDTNKKYVIDFKNEKTGKTAKIIIATIDSFMYAIGNTNHSFYDKFQGIIDSIIDNYIKSDKAGQIKYAGVNPKLNKETLIIIDEAQDLTRNYADALLNIMRNKYIDAYIVGDKLQSISYEDNAFTYLYDNTFPSINIEKLEPSNVCRRFTHEKLTSFVNEMVPFDKYNLPQVQPYKGDESDDANPLVFFQGEPIYQNDNNDKIAKEINKIMGLFKNEVETNNRKPNDFLIITPFTSNNPLVDALQGYIDTFWKERLAKDKDDYFRYAIFHKSEEGNSINLDESKESTRIVSTHSSKGDGRNVVFLIGFTEGALKRFSIRNDSLVFDSLFHVAITRMKQKMYIQTQNNGDYLAQKISRFTINDLSGTLLPNIHIFNSLKYGDIISKNAPVYFNIFEEKFIAPANLDKLGEDHSEKRIVDAGNHAVRYATLLTTLLIKIINKENAGCEDVKRQIKAKFHKLKESNITPVNRWDKYYTIINEKEIAVARIADRGRDYITYYDIILNTMRHVNEKIVKNIKNDIIPNFCPFESVILQHMLDIKNDGTFADIKITDVYNIVDIYNHSYQTNTNGHQTCLCDKSFCVEKADVVVNNNINSLKEYLHQHFDKVKYIEKCIDAFHEKYPTINWLYQHVVKYNGNSKNFKLWRKFTLIGYDNERVIIAYIKPQFNGLNYNEILMDSIYDTYLVKNVEQYETVEGVKTITENYKRFFGKKITTCIFALDKKEPYYINWIDDGINLIDANSALIKESIYTYLKEHYILENNGIYYFYNYWRRNCPEDQKGAGNFVAFLLDKYNEIKSERETDKKKFPAYVDEFLNSVKLRVDMYDEKRQKKTILANYDNKNYFMTELDKKLDGSIKRYLDMKDEDDSGDESE